MTIQKTEKIILGIDPGTNLMGYGVLRVQGNRAKMEAMGVPATREAEAESSQNARPLFASWSYL